MSDSRRRFLSRLAGVAASAAAWPDLNATPLHRPIGLQLYTVGDALSKDLNGTLKKISAMGYKEVELAQNFGLSAHELATAFKDNGLTCRSAHMFDLLQRPGEFMDFAKELGAKYVVTSFNPPPIALSAMRDEKPDFQAFARMLEQMSLDDYKRSANICNNLAVEAMNRELVYAYHNHNLEFKKFGNTTGYETLLEETDPKLVKFEMDCGWVTAAGYDPAVFLEKYPSRIKLLHIKAFKAGAPSLSLTDAKRPQPAELGRGVPDYKAIFAAVKRGSVEQYYVEQEPPFTDMTSMEAIKVDHEYLTGL
jgi:sugar phosphate isomerase/epimerase